MYAIEFEAKVKDGVIEVPLQYRAKLKDLVRVIILAEGEAESSTLIDRLLEKPLEVRGFEPLSREEAHVRG